MPVDKIVIAANYPIRPDRIGGMDRFFWRLNQQLKNQNIKALWVFPKAQDDFHYQEEGLEIYFIDGLAFEKDLTRFLIEIGGTALLVTHFLPYNTRYQKEWKSAGAYKIIAVDHMSRPIKSRKISYRFRYFLKGLFNYYQVDQVVAVSSFVKESVKKELGPWWSAKTKVIYNGVDQSVFSLQAYTPGKLPVFFAIGHLIREKGFQVLLRACSILNYRNLDFKLYIAGEGPYKAKLEALVINLGLTNKVFFLGSISNQEEWLGKSDLAIIPSLWKEAFGFTVVEAMSCGATIIASKTGGISEILENKECLVKSGDERKLAAAIEKNLTSKGSLENRISNSEVVRSRFSLEKMVDGHLGIIKSFL
jgi:L-malate glycosyltransferase